MIKLAYKLCCVPNSLKYVIFLFLIEMIYWKLLILRALIKNYECDQINRDIFNIDCNNYWL